MSGNMTHFQENPAVASADYANKAKIENTHPEPL